MSGLQEELNKLTREELIKLIDTYDSYIHKNICLWKNGVEPENISNFINMCKGVK